ncbi:hypothetical protein Goshw_011621 [Gossypium schwendimanii]|uniref:Uncharacterized protein n=1 Tax=Gossypium schwendimanii TaxID=34291 RepID=A0A7J9L2Z7_GOSSC|nr:hypothetical protein [Gossypium schwendimanii]
MSNSKGRTRDVDCLIKWKHGGFCDITTKKCRYLPRSEQMPSNSVPMVDAKCNDDTNCAKV